MKKVLLLFTVVLVAMVGFTSCSDDEPSGALSGWYAADLPSKGSDDYFGSAYHFINGNTVEHYPTIAGTPRWTGYFSSQALPSPMNGYYIQADMYQTYTYSVIDNKVYIPSQGAILTISGNSLIKDGGRTYRKM